MESLSKKIKHGMKWQFYGNTIGQVIYFVNGIVLARILSPKDFGIYGMALILSDFAFMFWNLGLDSAIIQKKEVEPSDLNNVFSVSLIMGSFCFLLIWFFAPLLAIFFREPSIKPLSRLIGTTFIIYAVDRVYSALLDRNLRFKEVSFLGILNPLLYTVVAVPLAILGFGPFSFVFGIIAGCLALTILRIYFGIKFFEWRPKFKLEKKGLKNLLRFGLGVTTTNVVTYFCNMLPQAFIGRLLTSADLGYYMRSTNLSVMPLQKVQGNILRILLPAFSGVQDDKKKIREWFLKFNFFTYAILTPFLIFFIFFPKEVIVGLFGQKWETAVPLLKWSSLAVLIGASSMYYSSIVKAIGKPFLNLLVESIKILPLLIAIFFLRNVGLFGFVIILFLSSIIGAILYISLLCKRQILVFYDQLICMIEPGTIALLSVLAVFSMKLRIIAYTKSETLQFILLFGVYILLVGLYYLYRFYKRPMIGYLKFNIRSVLRFK